MSPDGAAPIPDAVLEVLACPVCGESFGPPQPGGPPTPVGPLEPRESPRSDSEASTGPPTEPSRSTRRPGRALRCEFGHAFDVARQGYVNLRTGSAPAGTADTAAMVAARDEFLGQGHYAPIADAVTRSIADAIRGQRPESAGERGAESTHSRPRSWPVADSNVRDDEGGGDATRSGERPGVESGPVIVDVGAGTGYYLRHALAVLDGGLPETGIGGAEVQAYGVAMDVSPYALRRAARAHPRAAAVGADAWRRLPLRDSSISALIDVFAPRNADEFRRVLRPDGVLVVVTPSSEHLAELIDKFGAAGMLSVDETKDERVERTLGDRFALASRDELTFSLALMPDDVGRLIRMGPSAHHVSETSLRETLTALTAEDARTDVTVAVTVSTFRPAPRDHQRSDPS